MSQTWENAQQRGVVKLGVTTSHLLGSMFAPTVTANPQVVVAAAVAKGGNG